MLSASPLVPDGLENSSGQVGRNSMRHTTGSIYGRFEQSVRMWRGETMAGVIGDESGHDPGRGFAGGCFMEVLSLGPSFLVAFAEPGWWGPDFTEIMDAYARTAGMWITGEDMPQETNRVTLNHDVRDQHGLPAPDVHVDDHPNDVALCEHAWSRGQAVYEAVGATGSHRTPPYPSTHDVGTARVSERPEDGVVDKWGRAHDVPNLFVSDGSVLTSGAAAFCDGQMLVDCTVPLAASVGGRATRTVCVWQDSWAEQPVSGTG